MSVITVVTRIFPVNTQSEYTTNLLKPSDLGKPVVVKECNVVDPRTGQKFLLETTFCLGKTKDLSNLNVPGLVPLTSVDCATKNGEENLGPKFALSVPRNIPFHKIPQLYKFTEHNELENSSPKPSIKLHLNLKQIREATKEKTLRRKRGKFVQPLLKYFVDNECLICGAILNKSRRHKVMYHMFSHVKLGAYSCEVCNNKDFSSAEDLYNHSIKHPGKLVYTCKVCNYKFNRKLFLTSHEKKHQEKDKKSGHLVTSVVCSLCRVKLSSWKSVLNHKKAHFGKESYTCLFCNKTFVSSCKFLHYHAHISFISSHHRCKVCQRVFSSRNRLQKHEKLHRLKLQYLCELCGKKFNFKYSLWRHIQLHSQNED